MRRRAVRWLRVLAAVGLLGAVVALAGPARLFLRSRYGYTRVADGPDSTERYLVERRFEPFVGVRLHLQ